MMARRYRPAPELVRIVVAERARREAVWAARILEGRASRAGAEADEIIWEAVEFVVRWVAGDPGVTRLGNLSRGDPAWPKMVASVDATVSAFARSGDPAFDAPLLDLLAVQYFLTFGVEWHGQNALSEPERAAA